MTWRSSAAEMKPLLSRSKTCELINILLSSQQAPEFRSTSHLERLSNLFLRVCVLHLAGHHRKKLCRVLEKARLFGGGLRLCAHTREVNGAIVVSIHLVDHVLKLRLGRILAERSHDSPKLLGGNLTWGGGGGVGEMVSARDHNEEVLPPWESCSWTWRWTWTNHRHPCPAKVSAWAHSLRHQHRHDGGNIGAGAATLTKREKASLNSDTCSSVSESAYGKIAWSVFQAGCSAALQLSSSCGLPFSQPRGQIQGRR